MAAASEVVRMCNLRAAEGFIAVNAETRKKFWLDRSRTAAISRHTNAFKVNEDVVIPLPRMGDYCDGIERINIELSTQNKLALCDALARASSRVTCRCIAGDTTLDAGSLLIGDRRQAALDYVAGGAPALGSGCWKTSTCRWPRPNRSFPPYGVKAGELTNRAEQPDACSTVCRITRSARRGSRSCMPA
jgi:FAD/FMN-containing dehydrogenase